MAHGDQVVCSLTSHLQEMEEAAASHAWQVGGGDDILTVEKQGWAHFFAV